MKAEINANLFRLLFSSTILGEDVSFLAHSAVFKAANFESCNKNREQKDHFVEQSPVSFSEM